LWPGYTAEVRPLTIHVIDSMTNEPVEGAVVYYELTAMRNRNNLGIPLPYENYRSLVVRRIYTDSNGTARIPEQVYRFKMYEEPRWESVYVNIETEQEDRNVFNSLISKHGYNPMGELKGMIVINHAPSSYAGEGWRITPADDAVYTVQHNWGTFLKDEEIITVKLVRR